MQLRPARAADWPALFAAASDPGIWAGHPASDRWQEPVFRAFFENGLASGGMLVARAGGAVIGSSRFDYSRCLPGEVEVGWTFLARSHWGGGVNHAMKALMVGHALTKVDSVMLMIGDSNFRSRTAAERIGAVLSARTATAELSTGPVVHVIYSIGRAGFVAGPLAPLWAQRIS
ncbi:GNAT family N-acetyltransferase [Sandarakinorhabdus sp.]|uniref:GNAT family N-acetyltransferase n=1 Tax=Sandarakinorhabdus sp. TaxID=1916663 RepID=UPI0033421FFD